MSVNDRLLTVKRLRRARDSQKESLALWEQELRESYAYERVEAEKEALSVINAELKIAEEAARREIAESYDGHNKKGPGWGVRIMKRFVYDLNEATKWALQNLPGALVLDTRIFERAVEAIPDSPVEIRLEITGTIASDLSEVEGE